MNSLRPRVSLTPIYCAFGISFVFLQTLLCGMILDDTRSLILGNWDIYALMEFLALTFIVIPVVISAIFYFSYYLNEKLFIVAFIVLVSFLFSREIDYFLFRNLFIEELILRTIILFFVFVISVFIFY